MYTNKRANSFATKMRMKPTAAESKLHNALIDALKNTTTRVHFQHPIGHYIADFYIPYAQLIIEADGATHAGRKLYDQRRETYMRNKGMRTIRFSNIEIFQDITGVIKQILDACGELKSINTKHIPITYCEPATRYHQFIKSKSKQRYI